MSFSGSSPGSNPSSNPSNPGSRSGQPGRGGLGALLRSDGAFHDGLGAVVKSYARGRLDVGAVGREWRLQIERVLDAGLTLSHLDGHKHVHLLPPLPYRPFLALWRRAALVLTDSGGLQEETTALGIPCLTVRDNTERPVTVDLGTNRIAGTDAARVLALAGQRLDELDAAGPDTAPVRRPPLWDGRSAARIVERLATDLLR